jgi:hypothetical protein
VLTATPILNLTTFMLAAVVVTVPLVIVSVTYRHVTRTCHRCGRRTRLDKRTCTHCGYDSAPVTYTR